MSARDDIAARLLRWYDRHARALPWRSPPGSPPPDPYRVWLSEVMLQQTTVMAVKPFFDRFISRWPDVAALAAAPHDEVMAAWAGLGYYSRARNLVKAAKAVAEAGGFPTTEAELRRLPGLGAYTAAAVAAIAFDQRAVVVDANVERVVARLFVIDTPLPGGRKAIRAAAETITPDRRPGDFAQGMMDLGSTICTPRAPKCLLCPVAEDCAGRQTGKPERFPVKPVKRALPERAGQAYWIERENHVWLVTRPPDGLFGGMRALPDDGWSAQKDGSGEPPLPGEWAMLGTVRHSFTHAKLTLTILSGTSDAAPPGKGDWWPLEQLTQAGLPTLFANASRLVLAR